MTCSITRIKSRNCTTPFSSRPSGGVSQADVNLYGTAWRCDHEVLDAAGPPETPRDIRWRREDIRWRREAEIRREHRLARREMIKEYRELA